MSHYRDAATSQRRSHLFHRVQQQSQHQKSMQVCGVGKIAPDLRQSERHSMCGGRLVDVFDPFSPVMKIPMRSVVPKTLATGRVHPQSSFESITHNSDDHTRYVGRKVKLAARRPEENYARRAPWPMLIQGSFANNSEYEFSRHTHTHTFLPIANGWHLQHRKTTRSRSVPLSNTQGA